jgi:hypothetical protein
MLITPAQLIDEPLKLDETIAPGAIEYAPDIRQAGLLHVQGQAELIVEHRGPRESSSCVRAVWSRSSSRFRGTLTCCFGRAGPMPTLVNVQLRKMRLKSGIMMRAACCWRTPCASRCC